MQARFQLRLKQLSALGEDFFQTWIGLQPIAPFHPPSLKNPQHVPIDTPQQGWHRKDSKRLKHRARADLVEIMKRLRRQIGKPEISETAKLPLFPNIERWL